MSGDRNWSAVWHINSYICIYRVYVFSSRPARQLYRIESLLPPRRGVTAAVLMEMIKETHCTLLFQLLMFPSHSPSVNNAFSFDITEQTLNMDSITACLSATDPNPSIGTVSTANLPVQRAQTSNNLNFMVTPCINNTEPSFITNWCT